MSTTGTDAFEYLTEERGLTRRTIEKYELGFDRTRRSIAIPIRDAQGESHSAKFRSIDPDAPGGKGKRGMARPASLYPLQILTGHAWPDFVVLCEGELDALLLNQSGIPAVTSTAGTSGWQAHPEWAELFAGWEVAVIYDAGSERLAAKRAAYLCEAGAEAWAVALPLERKEDITNWFMTHQKSAAELRQLIQRSRRTPRKRAGRGT
jgi:DNA primase